MKSLYSRISDFDLLMIIKDHMNNKAKCQIMNMEVEFVDGFESTQENPFNIRFSLDQLLQKYKI